MSQKFYNPLSPLITSTPTHKIRNNIIINDPTKELPGEQIIVSNRSSQALDLNVKSAEKIHVDYVLDEAKSGNSTIKNGPQEHQINSQLLEMKWIPKGALTPKMKETIVDSNKLIQGMRETLDPHTILTAKMMIQDQSVEVVIDTGAGVSICTPILLQKLGLKLTENSYQGPPLRMATSDGYLIVVGKSYLSISLGTQCLQVLVLVVKELCYDLILGNDFLWKNKVVIDAKKGILSINGFDLPCTSRSLLQKNKYEVRLENQVSIPA